MSVPVGVNVPVGGRLPVNRLRVSYWKFHLLSASGGASESSSGSEEARRQGRAESWFGSVERLTASARTSGTLRDKSCSDCD